MLTIILTFLMVKILQTGSIFLPSKVRARLLSLSLFMAEGLPQEIKAKLMKREDLL